MRRISILTLITSLFVSTFVSANEVNVFNARHYKADAELYSKFTNMTGIKVNLINGKSGALEKRIIEEGADSSADLYITADAGRCGAMDAKGHLQGGLTSGAIIPKTPKPLSSVINSKELSHLFVVLVSALFLMNLHVFG